MSKALGGFKRFDLLPAINKAIVKKGFSMPTPIQRKSIPIILSGQDMISIARTGSGKTAAFLIPILNSLEKHSTVVGVRAVIISPTRELTHQTYQFAKEFAKFTDLRVVALVGGEGLKQEFDKLASNPDIIIATPGRLMHMQVELGYSLSTVKIVVLDEVDRLIELGLIEQVKHLLKCMVYEQRQTLCFSATMPEFLTDFKQTGLNNPVLVKLDQEHRLPDTLQLDFFVVRPEDKEPALFHILLRIINIRENPGLILIFVATKHHVDYLELVLQTANIQVSGLYGDMEQSMRNKTLSMFRKGRFQVLVVTDVAARGLDIPILDYVIHFDFPYSPKLFIHRSGRVARAGKIGKCYALVTQLEMGYLFDTLLETGKQDEARIGRFSEEIIRFEQEEYQMLRGEIPQEDLKNKESSMNNALKLYNKTRKAASKASVSKGKLLEIGLHPYFEGAANDQEEFIQKIRQYRPALNSLEFAAKNKKRSAIVKELQNTRQSLLKGNKQVIQQQKDNYDAAKGESDQIASKRSRPTSSIQPSKKRVKRGQIQSYQKDQFVTNDGKNYFENDQEINQLAMQMPDEDVGVQNARKKKWDKSKKKYVNLDNQNILKQFQKSDKAVKLYKEWSKSTHKKFQRPGEKENPDFARPRAGGSRYSTETKNRDQIIKERALQKHKRSQNVRKYKRDQKMKRHVKNEAKIEKHKAYTRSKMIIKKQLHNSQKCCQILLRQQFISELQSPSLLIDQQTLVNIKDLANQIIILQIQQLLHTLTKIVMVQPTTSWRIENMQLFYQILYGVTVQQYDGILWTPMIRTDTTQVISLLSSFGIYMYELKSVQILSQATTKLRKAREINIQGRYLKNMIRQRIKSNKKILNHNHKFNLKEYLKFYTM